EKYFAPIPAGKKIGRQLPTEPKQTQKRTLTVDAKVPANALYKTWHMAGRFTPQYYATDFVSDMLSRGQSSRLYQKLVKEREIFTSISSFVMGTIDPGMLVVSGRVKEGVTLEQAEAEVDAVVADFKINMNERELEKVKNQALATLEFGEVEVLNRAMNLAFASLSGDASVINQEGDIISSVQLTDVSRVANDVLREENASVMYYQAVDNKK
ncbi:MAG: M16 family metallopeptidase, partial [Flammeovirgaceae bacterium]